MTSATGDNSDSFAPHHRPSAVTTQSSSYYTMSDNEDETVMHGATGRGVKLLFSKSKVYVHPTPNAKDNIAGYIALLQQKSHHHSTPAYDALGGGDGSVSSSDLLLAWIPEASLGDEQSIYVKVDLCDGDSPPKQSFLVPPPPTVTSSSSPVGGYAFAVPLNAVYSLQIRPPSIGWWYGSVIINSRHGDSFPALFFHDNECQSTILQKRKRTRDTFDPFGDNGQMFWGGDEVLRWVKRYVKVERSGAEPNIYMIEPNEEDLKSFGERPTTAANTKGKGKDAAAKEAEMDPFFKFFKETGWNIMNQFSKVTTMTRRAAQDLAESPSLPPQVRRLIKTPEVQTLQNEFDSARIYLARWAMSIAEQSERDRRRRLWTVRDVMQLVATDVGEFELLEGASALSIEERRKPVTQQEWDTFFDPQTGRLSVTVDEVKERIFHGGLDPNDGVRKEAWLFLLGVHEWFGTADERKAEIASLRDQYYKLKLSWWERLDGEGGEGEAGEWWREQRSRIEKDVHRTDRNVPIFAGDDTPHPDPNSPFADVGTNVHLEQLKEMLLTYNEYNKDLGYVQGMSDLLAPIYAVIQDDAIAFWAFQHFMDRMERNFLRDQSGMRCQLEGLDQLVHFMDPKLWEHLQKADSTNFFFFFRMILVWYKREFPWNDVLRLWESLWTDHLSANFHLFIALAILEKHREPMMTHLQAFDEVLKYINELSGNIDLDSTLIKAEALFIKFQRVVEAVDKKKNFPAPRRWSSVGWMSPSRSASKVADKPADSANKPADGSPPSTPPAESSANGGTAATDSDGSDNSASSKTKSRPKADGSPEPKVITPELRGLLNKTYTILPRSMVSELGEGMPDR